MQPQNPNYKMLFELEERHIVDMKAVIAGTKTYKTISPALAQEYLGRTYQNRRNWEEANAKESI